MLQSQRWLVLGIAVLAGVGMAACGDEEPGPPAGPEAPPATSVTATTNVDTVTVSWTTVTGADSFRVELDGGRSTLTASGGATDTQVLFTSAEGIKDDVTYTAVVYATGEGGETRSENAPTVLTDFFPWDEHFWTSLHATGMGKQTFYNTAPNGGFEKSTGVPYMDLSCKSCHEPQAGGCVTHCHDVAKPGLGAEVDATLTGACGDCHSRQKAEAFVHGYSDVHRDAGMDCMECHTMEDVHGDGTPYVSMLEDGAIDARCEDCHTSLESNSYHSIHSSTVDCSACHIQSVVTCYNCHFETELALDVKKPYGQFKDWVFLMNYRGKVHAANFQSVVDVDDESILAMAPFYAHTVAEDAVECNDCHGNAALQEYFDENDGVIDVVWWNGTGLSYMKGRIPVTPELTGTMKFAVVQLNQPGGSVWSHVGDSVDEIQIVYGSPLTAEQMAKLKDPK